jgi:hypothetical protein
MNTYSRNLAYTRTFHVHIIGVVSSIERKGFLEAHGSGHFGRTMNARARVQQEFDDLCGLRADVYVNF